MSCFEWISVWTAELVNECQADNLRGSVKLRPKLLSSLIAYTPRATWDIMPVSQCWSTLNSCSIFESLSPKRLLKTAQPNNAQGELIQQGIKPIQV